jgi:hypothetical protein
VRPKMKSVRKLNLRIAAFVLPLHIVWFSAGQGVVKAQTQNPPAQQAAPTAAPWFENLQVLREHSTKSALTMTRLITIVFVRLLDRAHFRR